MLHSSWHQNKNQFNWAHQCVDLIIYFSFQTNNKFDSLGCDEWFWLRYINYMPITKGKKNVQQCEGVSVFSCSPPGGVEGGGVGQRSFYHSRPLIKTNDSRCRMAPGKGTAGRRVCVAGSTSLPPPSILLRKEPTAVSTQIPAHNVHCIEKKEWSKCKWYSVMH